jgi:histone deacetylase complex regulatory component SIN3
LAENVHAGQTPPHDEATKREDVQDPPNPIADEIERQVPSPIPPQPSSPPVPVQASTSSENGIASNPTVQEDNPTISTSMPVPMAVDIATSSEQSLPLNEQAPNQDSEAEPQVPLDINHALQYLDAVKTQFEQQPSVSYYVQA